MICGLGAGFGGIALTGLLAAEEGADPAAPRPPHFPARARRAIMLFMEGGPSHHDLFDYKPLLERDHGKPLPLPLPRVLSNTDRFRQLLRPLSPFRRRGRSGAWVSDLLPHLAEVADELCLIHSVHGSNSQHGAALLEWHTGSTTFVRPSLGSWLLYGLGSENRNLPGYVTICQPLRMAGADLFGSAFLPAVHQGTPLGYGEGPASEARFPFLSGAGTARDLQRMELDLIRRLGESHARRSGSDATLDARLRSFELAFRMQTEAPEVLDLRDEPESTLRLYGIHEKETADFGRQCLLARRLAERGVRFVQCNAGGWDNHTDLRSGLPRAARRVDRPIAGLLRDLKARGLLEDTLVVWGGEFGRTPMAEGTNGRDHNPHGYTMWMAGGGVKAGITYGRTDDYGFRAVEDPMHVHDVHATILHLLGLDHERLTYRHAGRDFRLTDVHGKVATRILA
jgi:hypothetical protein